MVCTDSLSRTIRCFLESMLTQFCSFPAASWAPEQDLISAANSILLLLSKSVTDMSHLLVYAGCLLLPEIVWCILGRFYSELKRMV